MGANKGYALKNKYFTKKNHTLISTTNVWLVQREATWRNRVARTPHSPTAIQSCVSDRAREQQRTRQVNQHTASHTTRQFFIHFILLYYLIKKSQDGAFIIGDIRDNSYILLQLFGEMIDRASSTNFAGNERARSYIIIIFCIAKFKSVSIEQIRCRGELDPTAFRAIYFLIFARQWINKQIF